MGKLDVLIKDFNKEYKEDIAFRGIPTRILTKIPFSSPRANYMTYGGLPRGRIVEFSGDENGGKTTTALDVVKNAQRLFNEEHALETERLNGIAKRTKTEEARLTYLLSRGAKQVVYADCENTLDEDWATQLGVDVASMILLKPQSQTAEQIFEMLLNMIETDEVGLMVIDSLGVMLSSQAYEKTMEERTYGGIAMALTLFSKKAELLCSKYDCTLIGINQMREDLNSQHGGLTTTGGKAWKHNCSVRLMFRKGSYIDAKGNEVKRSQADTPSGNLVEISVVKTKVFRPDRRSGYYTLRYTGGVDEVSDLVDVAILYSFIQVSGSWFVIADEKGEVIEDEAGEVIKLQGRTNLIQYLKEPNSKIILEELQQMVSKAMQQ